MTRRTIVKQFSIRCRKPTPQNKGVRLGRHSYKSVHKAHSVTRWWNLKSSKTRRKHLAEMKLGLQLHLLWLIWRRNTASRILRLDELIWFKILKNKRLSRKNRICSILNLSKSAKFLMKPIILRLTLSQMPLIIITRLLRSSDN